MDVTFVLGRLATILATSEHGEVVRIDVEVELRLRRPRQAQEDLVGRLDHGAALFADEMAVSTRSEMVRGGAVAEMGMDDDAQPLQVVEVAVDRRDVDIGSDGLDLGAQFLGGAVSSGIEQRVQEQDAGARHPSPLLPKQGQDVLDRVDVA